AVTNARVCERSSMVIGSIALVLIAVVTVGQAQAGSSAGSLAELVAEGEQSWRSSPDPRDPVACATCHHDPDETRGWAASFPKYRPLPPPEGRVMTLLQANAEAVQRHYGLADSERAALAITAYLTWRGAGVPISPGIVAGQPVFDGRLQALAESVGRGEWLYARRCQSCHDPGAVAPAALRFPRAATGQVESLEGFLGRHRPDLPSPGRDGKPNAVRVETGATLEVEVVLVPEPTRANDPVIKRVEFVPSETRKGKAAIIKLEVSDPNGDLGPQVLAFNATAGRAFAMAPPRWVWSLKSNYPDGVYQLDVDVSTAPTEPRDWHFVVADHKCNTT